MGMQFHESVRGARFFDHDVPKLIKSITRLADAIEESNRLQQEALAIAKEAGNATKSKNESAFTQK